MLSNEEPSMSKRIYHIHQTDLDKSLLIEQEAKKFAEQQNDAKRAGWHERRVAVMRFVLLLKFSQYPKLLAQLLATGEEQLIHHAPWDAYWGNGRNGRGESVMGKILMVLRKRLPAWGVE